MPTYTFKDTETGEIWEEYCSISERDEFLASHPNITTVLKPFGIVSGTGGIKNDDGFKDMMSRIADANPTTPIAEKYGRKDPTTVKKREIIKKWKNTQG